MYQAALTKEQRVERAIYAVIEARCALNVAEDILLAHGPAAVKRLQDYIPGGHRFGECREPAPPPPTFDAVASWRDIVDEWGLDLAEEADLAVWQTRWLPSPRLEALKRLRAHYGHNPDGTVRLKLKQAVPLVKTVEARLRRAWPGHFPPEDGRGSGVDLA